MPLLAIAALAPLSWSQSRAAARPDLEAAIGAWRSAHGSSWNYALDPETGWAQMVYGGHTLAPSAEPQDDAAFVQLALAAVPGVASLHGIEASTLSFENTHFMPLGQIGSGDKQNVRLRQSVNGVPVEGGFLNLLYSVRGELLSVQSSGLPGASTIGTQPAIDAADAAGFARAHFFAATQFEPMETGTPELLIAQIVANHKRTGHLAWKVECNWSLANTEPLRKLVYVDALNGALLRMDEGIHNDVHGTVSAMASPGLLPDIASNPETSQLMLYSRCQTGATTVYTDSTGYFNFPGINNTVSVTFTFVGTYASVNYSPGTDYSLAVSLPANTANTVTMNPSATATITPQANAYISATRMRDWIRSIDPTDSHGDFVTVCNTNVGGSCNAFYNGSSINFYPAGGGCVNTAYSTVVTHEQGHWMNDRYNTNNGGDGMGEGNADVWAMYLWDTPVIGANFCGAGCIIRTGNNMRQFCGDCCGGCYNEVHNDGEVWMGAAWKVRANLGNSLGGPQGDLTANTLFLEWMNGYNQTQIRSIIETQWMTLDDNDGNISNGTPHFTEIDNGFRTQGFPGLTVSCPSPSNVCMSSVNSTGNMATMGYAGSNDISNNDFVLNAIGLPANKTGLFFFGQNQALVPFGNGWRCVGSPIYRLPPTTSNMFGDLVWPLDLGSLPSGVQFQAGQTWYFQAWYRDPAAGGANFNASDALQVPWCQ